MERPRFLALKALSVAALKADSVAPEEVRRQVQISTATLIWAGPRAGRKWGGGCARAQPPPRDKWGSGEKRKAEAERL